MKRRFKIFSILFVVLFFIFEKSEIFADVSCLCYQAGTRGWWKKVLWTQTSSTSCAGLNGAVGLSNCAVPGPLFLLVPRATVNLIGEVPSPTPTPSPSPTPTATPPVVPPNTEPPTPTPTPGAGDETGVPAGNGGTSGGDGSFGDGSPGDGSSGGAGGGDPDGGKGG